MLRPLEVIRAHPPHDTTLQGLLESRAAADPTGALLRVEQQALTCAQFSASRIVDDEGRDVADGTTGEIWVRTPILMQGDYRDPEQSWATTRPSSRW